MRPTAALALATMLVLCVSADVIASGPDVQPSYESLMAMPAPERRATLRTMDSSARLTVFRIHIDRWLETHRTRLDQSQIALVRDFRDHLTPERHLSRAMAALESRLRCELWRSDLAAMVLPQVGEVSGSWLSDVRFWLRECVVGRAIETVF